MYEIGHIPAVRRSRGRDHMEERNHSKVEKISWLTSEIDGLYHAASVRVGLSDSEMYILYTISVEGGSCPLRDVYKLTGLSRQTVNSAIRKLEAEGAVTLEKYRGRSKLVRFTDSGSAYAERTVGKILQAERNVFGRWEETEIDQYIRMLERFITDFTDETKDIAAGQTQEEDDHE